MKQNIFFLYFLVIFFSFLFSCTAQVSESSLIKIDDKDELKYVLTYLQPAGISQYTDEKNHFFIRLFILKADSYILLDHEEHIQKEYFYFLVSSFDEAAHIEARLFKSKGLINPVIEKITESADGEKFLIYVTIFKPRGSKTKNEIISVKSREFRRNKEIVFRIRKY